MDNILLLKTLLLSTSQINILRYCKDKKKRGRIIGTAVAYVIVYAAIMFYCVLMCIGYGAYGMIEAVPVLCALIISVLAFFFTFFKSNGYLFNFKEYDMLMSLPFASKTVAASKFLYMYIKSLPWYLSVSLAMMIGYGHYAGPAFYVYIIWIILTLILPVIPMLASAFLGFLIARISAGFRKTNIIQTALSFLVVVLSFSLRFIFEDLFRNGKVETTLEQAFDMTRKTGRIYLPAGWFEDAILKQDLLSMALLIMTSLVLFAVVFRLVGRSYRQINSALKSHAASRNYKVSELKTRNVLNAIAYKEFKRLSGSTVYMTNAAVGEFLALLFGMITLVFGFDKIIGVAVQNAPFDYTLLQPAIPFIIYFFIGMMATTACSPSLEGKNYWIVKSLPIEMKTLYKGKMLFNMYLTVPFTVIAISCLCISAKVPVIDAVLYLILGMMLCALSTAWGCVCGIRHMRLDWENEVEVIKQGAAVGIYLMPNMFITMGLMVGVVFLGMKMDHRIMTAMFIVVVALLSFLCYLRVMSLAGRKDIN